MTTPVVHPPFASHLERWGPGHEPCASLAEAERYCRHLATGHYENFPVTSIVLPKRLRQPMANVYAFCRWADDLGDEVDGADASLELLAWWRGELNRCFDGEATHPVFVALRSIIDEFALSDEPFDDLISAFEQDQTVTSYETLSQLEDYCRRSANPVGRIVLRLFDVDTPERVAMSDDVCTGLQLINFWQDVARDADIGRTYLPADKRREYAYNDSMLTVHQFSPEFVALMSVLVDDARRRLRRGHELSQTLSGRLRVVIDLFARGGLAIADKIERNGYDVWRARPTVSKWDVAKLFCASVWSAGVRR